MSDTCQISAFIIVLLNPKMNCIVSVPVVYIFSENLGAFSKFQSPEWRHKARSTLRTHKYEY